MDQQRDPSEVPVTAPPSAQALQDAQEALRVSEARYEHLMERASALVFELTLQGELLFVNAVATAVTGYSVEVLQGQKLEMLLFSDTQRQQLNPLFQALQAGDVTDYPLELTAKDGSRVILALNTANVYGPGGQLERIVGLARDVTARTEMERQMQQRTAQLTKTVQALEQEIEERRRAEAGLRESRSMLQSLFESTPDGVILTDATGQIVRVNERAEALFGYPREALHGQPVEMLVPEALQQRHRQHRESYHAAPSTRPMGRGLEPYGLRRDGSRFPADIMLGPVEMQDSTYVIVVVHDVSQRAEMERQLRASASRFRAVFDNAPFGITLVDPQGRLMAVNPRLAQMLGYPEAALQGQHFLEITHPEDVATSRQLFEALLQGGQNRYPIEKRFLREDGETLWARVHAALVRDQDGQPWFSVGIVTDITTQRRVASELAEVRRRLRHSQEAERLFLAQELHDGPIQDLHAVAFQLQALEGLLPDGSDPQYLERGQEIVARTTQALRDICQELRPPALAEFGLHAALRSYAEQFQARYPELQLQLDLARDRQELPEPTRLGLYRIYQQALSNVARHAAAGRIDVRFYLNEEHAVLEVEDDGQGFQVPHSWIESVRQGRLGLAGSAERAETLGGRLEVHSIPGDGALIRAIVPRSR